MDGLTQEQRQELLAAGAPLKSVNDFQKALRALNLPPRPTREKMKGDTSKARGIYRAGGKLLDVWPSKPERDAAQARGQTWSRVCCGLRAMPSLIPMSN